MAVETGSIVEGKVTGVTKFGAFVSLPEGQSGMVHISEISEDYVKDIADHVKEGDTVRVLILGKDDKGRISLSIRKAKEKEKPPMSFEDLIAKFKHDSDEKMSDLKKSVESKRGGFSRKGSGR